MMFLAVVCVATRGPERLRRSGVTQSDVDGTILAPCVYREATALKDLSIGRLSRGPVRGRMPQDAGQVSSERMTAAAFRVLNSASVIRFRPLHLLIRQPGRIVNCNQAVEIDCPPRFTTAPIQNGVIT